MTLAPALLRLAADRNLGVLATLKRDGRPQLSNINYHFSAETRLVRISVTDDRAKVKNLRRDPRASLHVSSSDGWSYAVLEGNAELSEVTRAPDDSAMAELVELYRSVRGEDHPDWDDYRRAMIADHRLVAGFTVTNAYGMA